MFVAAAKDAIEELFSIINTIFLPDMERNATFQSLEITLNHSGDLGYINAVA